MSLVFFLGAQTLYTLFFTALPRATWHRPSSLCGQIMSCQTYRNVGENTVIHVRSPSIVGRGVGHNRARRLPSVATHGSLPALAVPLPPAQPPARRATPPAHGAPRRWPPAAQIPPPSPGRARRGSRARRGHPTGPAGAPAPPPPAALGAQRLRQRRLPCRAERATARRGQREGGDGHEDEDSNVDRSDDRCHEKKMFHMFRTIAGQTSTASRTDRPTRARSRDTNGQSTCEGV